MCGERAERRGLLPGRRGRTGGGAAVGFAVVAPLLLLLVFGLIDLARFAFTVISVREAASIAVRAAAVGRSEAEARAAALARVPFPGEALALDIRCFVISVSGGVTSETPMPCGGALDPTATRRASVRATTAFRFLLPYLPGGTIPVVQQTEVTS